MEIIKTKEQLEEQNIDNKIIFKESFYGDYFVYNIDYFNQKEKNFLLKKIFKSHKDWNEVLSNNTNRKIYFDIEHVYDSLEEMNTSKKIIIKELEEDIKKYILNIDKETNIDNINVLYMDASGFTKEKNKYKLSLHVIINNYGYFTNHKKLFIFIDNFNKFMENKYNNFIDFEVYGDFRLFRTVFSISPKDGKDRRLKINDTGNISFWELFVGEYNKKNKNLDFLILDNIPPINNIPPKIKHISSDINKNYIDLTILPDIMKKYDDTFYIYKFNNKNNIININRKKSSLCEVCNTKHDNENAFLVFNEKTVSFGCYRNKEKKMKIIYNKNNSKEVYHNEFLQNDIDNKMFNNLLLITLDLRKKIKEIKYPQTENIPPKIKCTTKNKFQNRNKLRTSVSFEKYYQLGVDIIQKKETLNILINNFCNEKNIYKVKSRALRVFEYLEVLKKNNINDINITLKKLFNFKKIEFIKYIKDISLGFLQNGNN